jgi:hypothetical protein
MVGAITIRLCLESFRRLPREGCPLLDTSCQPPSRRVQAIGVQESISNLAHQEPALGWGFSLQSRPQDLLTLLIRACPKGDSFLPVGAVS